MTTGATGYLGIGRERSPWWRRLLQRIRPPKPKRIPTAGPFPAMIEPGERVLDRGGRARTEAELDAAARRSIEEARRQGVYLELDGYDLTDDGVRGFSIERLDRRGPPVSTGRRFNLGHLATLADALEVVEEEGLDPERTQLAYTVNDDGVWLEELDDLDLEEARRALRAVEVDR